MSHFVTTVLIPQSTPPDAVESAVAALLEPFDENTEVDTYPTGCYCLGNLAHRAGIAVAEREIGAFDRLRGQYWALPETERPEWSAYVAPYKAVVDRIEQAHPLYQKPDLDCEDCHGTGIRLTTYNPDSQWDWWEIGGRWEGWLGETNSMPVTDLLQDEEKIPFAMVTPDGQWHQRGEMGWFGTAYDEKADAVWKEEVRELLQPYPDALAVACDLHI